MPLDITYLGHSGFLFSDGTLTLAVDPYLTGNPVAVQKQEEIYCHYIALTHGHGDHLGDTIPIARRCKATVIAPYEVCNYLNEQGIDKTDAGNPGGRIELPFGSIAFTPAIHSSSYEGRYMGLACGLVIRMGDKCIYHAGDTALFSDMKLIGQIAKPDVACLPCGGRYTMTPALAKIAAEYVAAPVAIPIHWKTYPKLAQDIRDFAPQGVRVKAMKPGETWRCE
ncbi:MAG: metal-dependent hydrolase [Phycisphaeraceae bacterium]|nr:metal-dependent hydrolase [Phycisphaeraceae bacterium]